MEDLKIKVPVQFTITVDQQRYRMVRHDRGKNGYWAHNVNYDCKLCKMIETGCK